MNARVFWIGVCVVAGLSCGSDGPAADGGGGRGGSMRPAGAGGTGAAADGGEPAEAGTSGGALPLVPKAAVTASPATAPAGLPSAPGWTEPIRYTKSRGSVMLYLPAVPGAGDYRVYALNDGVRVTEGEAGSQHVSGATIFCAGLRQRNQCDDTEAMDFGPSFRNPPCSRDARAVHVPKTLVQQVQLDGLSGKTTIAVEAIDALCPFPGAFGAVHADIACSNDRMPVRTASYRGASVQWESCPKTFPVRTEAEIRADYGSLIINGHGPAPAPPEGESPFKSIALPAPDKPLTVLRRAIVEVEPLPPDQPPEGWTASDFFESFSDSSDVPQPITGAMLVPQRYAVQQAKLFQTSKLNLYTYAANAAQFFVSSGTLRSVMPDIAQQIMASNMLYPRRAFAVPDAAGEYLHVTFETQTNATQRRYWWFVACGAEAKGQTIVDGKLAPASGIVATPSFMDPLNGSHISTAGWNCLQLVPRGGNYGNLAGGPTSGKKNWRPETDIRVLVNVAVTSGFNASDNSDTVFNMSPAQARGDAKIEGSWMRQWDANKKLVGVMLDDQMFIEQRTTFDVYFNRGRVVMYANGVQKICNDFTHKKLTMAEAAVGVGHVLYHSSAERTEFARNDWIRTAQYYYRYNTPFLDHRSFDNYGVRAGAQLPGDFEEAQCYRSEN